MKCLIVEDEVPAITVLESHIGHFRELEIVGKHHNAMDAMVTLQTKRVDILFLDIELPKISGIQLLNSLHRKPFVIMTTAHREFALEGYELEITDYLLKPISLERFTKALTKVYRFSQTPMDLPQMTTRAPELSEPFIYVKAEREYVKILLRDILYIESIKNYVKIITEKTTVITLLGISEIGQKLPDEFVRVHRSFIVSIHHIARFTHSQIIVGNKSIPIGKHYKMNFLEWVGKNMI